MRMRPERTVASRTLLRRRIPTKQKGIRWGGRPLATVVRPKRSGRSDHQRRMQGTSSSPLGVRRTKNAKPSPTGSAFNVGGLFRPGVTAAEKRPPDGAPR